MRAEPPYESRSSLFEQNLLMRAKLLVIMEFVMKLGRRALHTGLDLSRAPDEVISSPVRTTQVHLTRFFESSEACESRGLKWVIQKKQ